MTKAVYVPAGGGIGDAIYDYFMRDTWQFIVPVKQAKPDIEIIAVFLSHCSSCPELVQFHPMISSVLTYPWCPPGQPREHLWKSFFGPEVKHIKDYAGQNKIRPESNPVLYLSKAEEQQAKEILEKPITVIHPFAGSRLRSFLPDNDGKNYCLPGQKCIEFCNRLANEGERVVVLGKSEVLEFGRNHDERLVGLDSKVIDLCNKTSARLSVHLTRNARAFFGTHSSMLVAAWTNDVPSLCFYPTRDRNGRVFSIEKNGGNTGTFALGKPFHDNFQMTPDEFWNLSVDTIYERFRSVIAKKR